MREQTLMMTRIKNEEQFIGLTLERALQVCQQVAIFDDGSTDATEAICLQSLGIEVNVTQHPWGWIATGEVEVPLLGGLLPAELHYLKSPFTHCVREQERVQERRDKNILWWYVKATIDFRHVLTLDGDEALSQQAIAKFPEIWDRLVGGVDLFVCPFIYLWDAQNQRRVDAIYGNDPSDGCPRLRFPRVFTIDRLSDLQLFSTHFAWLGQGKSSGGGARGGFHCGSVPFGGFTPNWAEPRKTFINAPILHYGYLEDERRQRKFKFYTRVDPGNKVEGEYKHIIGESNVHAPGPVKLIPYDEVYTMSAAEEAKWKELREQMQAVRGQCECEAQAQEAQWAKEDAAFGMEWAAQQRASRDEIRRQRRA